MYYLFSIFIFQEFGPISKATLRDSSTIPYAVLGDCSDHRARLGSQPRSRTCWLVSTLCSKTVPTTKYDYVPNHTQGLVNQSLRHARGLCRPPSTFTFPTMLEDWPISLYVMLGDCADHRAWLHSQPCLGTHQPLTRCARDLLWLLSDHNLGTFFLSYIWIGLIYN